jgi:hypothetical protein
MRRRSKATAGMLGSPLPTSLYQYEAHQYNFVPMPAAVSPEAFCAFSAPPALERACDREQDTRLAGSTQQNPNNDKIRQEFFGAPPILVGSLDKANARYRVKAHSS